jgi:hypothetical protein
VVSVRADMGVLCLLEDLRSRALALPVPFLDAGAMVEMAGLLVMRELPVLAARTIYLVAARAWIRSIPGAIRVARE